METRRVILTGATGFVGANLARRLLREGHELHLLVRKNCRTWRIEALRRKVKLHEVELGDMDRLGRVVGRIRPHWIFHLAAYGAYPSQNDFHKMIQTNFIETVSMVEACLKAGFESFIHFGSSSEYGFKDHAPSEKEGIDPNSFYAVTKASATLFCRYAARSRDARIITLRLYSVYGPWEEPTRLIPTLIIRGLNGELPPLVDPDVARDYVYVDDVTEACLRAVCATDREPGAVYNIGTGIQTSIRSVVETARRTMRIPAMPRWGSMRNREWDTTVWMADISSSRKRLGWRPRHTFQEGFRKTLAWFRSNPDVLEFYRTFGDSPGRD
jgi:nucleoside-diphosphate-sugar epimerase